MSASKKSIATEIDHRSTDLPPAKRRKGIEYTGVCVVFFCHDGAGSYVMAQRSMKARDEQGKWEFNGGGLEFGMTVEATLQQEVREELGADVLEAEFLGYRDVHRRPGGVQTHWIALDFKVRVDRTKVHNAEPHKFDAVEWFRLDALPPLETCASTTEDTLTRYGDRL